MCIRDSHNTLLATSSRGSFNLIAPTTCKSVTNTKFPKFKKSVKNLGGIVLNSCQELEDFKKKYKNIAKSIVNNSSKTALPPTRIIDLLKDVNPYSIRVKFGNYTLAKGSKSGWSYDKSTNQVLIGPEVKILNPKNDIKLEIEYSLL